MLRPGISWSHISQKIRLPNDSTPLPASSMPPRPYLDGQILTLRQETNVPTDRLLLVELNLCAHSHFLFCYRHNTAPCSDELPHAVRPELGRGFGAMGGDQYGDCRGQPSPTPICASKGLMGSSTPMRWFSIQNVSECEVTNWPSTFLPTSTHVWARPATVSAGFRQASRRRRALDVGRAEDQILGRADPRRSGVSKRQKKESLGPLNGRTGTGIGDGSGVNRRRQRPTT
ncbi:hypothetical protein ACVKN3_001755 [Luteibacter sp. PvP120]